MKNKRLPLKITRDHENSSGKGLLLTTLWFGNYHHQWFLFLWSTFWVCKFSFLFCENWTKTSKYRMEEQVLDSKISTEKNIFDTEIALIGKMYTISDKFHAKNVMSSDIVFVTSACILMYRYFSHFISILYITHYTHVNNYSTLFYVYRTLPIPIWAES